MRNRDVSHGKTVEKLNDPLSSVVLNNEELARREILSKLLFNK
jgi:hypothetical protein